MTFSLQMNETRMGLDANRIADRVNIVLEYLSLPTGRSIPLTTFCLIQPELCILLPSCDSRLTLIAVHIILG
jgi:hypothetical protein